MQAFRKFDSNNTGSITLRDLKKILVNMCPHLLSTYVEASLPLVSYMLYSYQLLDNWDTSTVLTEYNWDRELSAQKGMLTEWVTRTLNMYKYSQYTVYAMGSNLFIVVGTTYPTFPHAIFWLLILRGRQLSSQYKFTQF